MNEAVQKKYKAHQIYQDKAGEIIPSVTTILSVLNKPALVKWANNLGLQGIDSSKYTDAMATIGTLAHYLIECHLLEFKPLLAEYSKDDISKAETAMIKYLDWEGQNKLEPKLVEAQVVSEKYRFGGRIDLYGKLNGEMTLIDFKTCKAIYPEMICQLAAYKYLLEENGYPVKNSMILRVGRDENEGFEIRRGGNLSDHWSIFAHCLGIYQLRQKIGK